MDVRILTRLPVCALLAGTALVAMLPAAAHGQARLSFQTDPACNCSPPCLPPGATYPFMAQPSPGTGSQTQPGTGSQTQPGTGAQTQQGTGSPTEQGTSPSGAGNQDSGQTPSLGNETSSALGGDQVALSGAGYLDPAIPANRVRFRFDAAYDDNRPDRAEYFYGKCGCFRAAGDPHAPGPPLPETNVNYQDIDAYVEWAPWQRFSVFVEATQRFLDPQANSNASGLGDTKTGFRYAMLYDPTKVLTFQMKTYIPTGDAGLGLGTGHVSVEPSLLAWTRLSPKLFLEGQLTDWQAVGGTDFAGNILSYGAASTYVVWDNGKLRVAPVLEGLGWTVLSGQEFDYPENVVKNSGGETIINAKFGARIGFGTPRPGFFGKSDLYVGYGRALTGDVWYKDILRVEYRISY